MRKRDNGYTVIELMILISAIAIAMASICGFAAIFHGNFWYTEENVFKELKSEHPNITEIVKAKRHIFAKSVITVKENGVNHDYCLDSNILGNFEFSER
jgi:hypothetical protein